MIKLAIVGSRTFNDEIFFKEKLQGWIEKYDIPDFIVSGGAKGADTMAQNYAIENEIELIVFKPDYSKYAGKIAPLMRNTQIVNECTHVLAFPSESGSGTQDTIRKAKKLGKSVDIHFV